MITTVSKNDSSFLGSDITMKIAIENIIDFLKQNPEIAGLHFDIEFLPKSEIGNYKKFFKKVKTRTS